MDFGFWLVRLLLQCPKLLSACLWQIKIKGEPKSKTSSRRAREPPPWKDLQCKENKKRAQCAHKSVLGLPCGWLCCIPNGLRLIMEMKNETRTSQPRTGTSKQFVVIAHCTQLYLTGLISLTSHDFPAHLISISQLSRGLTFSSPTHGRLWQTMWPGAETIDRDTPGPGNETGNLCGRRWHHLVGDCRWATVQ